MTVRHPFARVVSAYHNKWPHLDFNEFINVVCSTPDDYANLHVQSMSWWLPHDVTPTMVRLENLQEDYAKARELVPWLARAFPHANATGQGHKWEDLLTETQKIKLTSRYLQDLKRFNYLTGE